MIVFEEKKELGLGEALNSLDMIQKVMDQMGSARKEVFASFIAMLMEEYCYQHDLNVVEELQMLTETAKRINDEMGKYEPN